MDIVKKNLVSVLCGVIALICLVLIFVPLGGWYSDLEADVVKRQKVGADLKAVKEAQRHWPTLSTKEEDKVALKEFPTDGLNKVGEGIVEGWKTTTTNYYNAAVARQTRVLTPLIAGLLPKANGRYLPLQFRDRYAEVFGIDANAAQAGGGGGAFGGGCGFGGGGFGGAPRPAGAGAATGVLPKNQKLLGTDLMGRTPPSNEEIALKQNEREAAIRTEKTVLVNGQPVNQAQVDLEVAKVKAAIGEQLVDQVARQAMIYIDPSVALDSQKNVIGVNPPDDETVFLAQVGLWVQQEICRGIYEVNKPAIDGHKDEKGQTQGVIAAPIKHLIGIRLTLPYQLPPAAVAGAAPAAPADEPKLPDPRPAAKVAVDFVRNPLGQTSNDMYDVLPFTLVMVCEADTVPQTMATMTYGRYMNIRSVDVQSVDAAVAQANRLLYGNKPVVQVTIRGQYLMMRAFLGKYMPANIIRGILTPPAAAGTPGGV